MKAPPRAVAFGSALSNTAPALPLSKGARDLLVQRLQKIIERGAILGSNVDLGRHARDQMQIPKRISIFFGENHARQVILLGLHALRGGLRPVREIRGDDGHLAFEIGADDFRGHCSSAAPPTCTPPCVGPHTPTSARTREVLPEPLGPMTPMASPAASVKLTLRTTAAWPSGGATATKRLIPTLSRRKTLRRA